MSFVPFIGADQAFALWAVLMVAATLGIWAERTAWGARISGAMVTLFVTFGLSNLGVIPASAPTYDAVWIFIVPLAIPLLLFKADLVRIVRETGPMLLAFAVGALGTVLGTIVAFRCLPLGEQGWQLAAIFCASYIGGSINFAATAEAVGLRSGDVLSAGVAADNLVMLLYFLVLFLLPSVGWLQRRFAVPRAPLHPTPAPAAPQSVASLPPLLAIGQALTLSTVICAVGQGVATGLGVPSASILIVTVVTVGLATVGSRWLGSLSVADTLGQLFMQIFFAVIGASANVATVLRVGPILFLLAALILTIHLVTLLLAGYLLRLDLAELVVASNANMGGPTTAAAMAAARRWDRLVTPAILCGTCGYAIATFIGVALGHVLQAWS